MPSYCSDCARSSYFPCSLLSTDLLVMTSSIELTAYNKHSEIPTVNEFLLAIATHQE